jgi:DNA-binding transcriptional ArsR family regulator
MIAQPSAESLTIDDVLDALADPQRRRLYGQIESEPGIVCSKVGPELPRSTVSVQLRRLREAGLISQQKQGQLIANHVRQDGAWQRFGLMLKAIFAADDQGASTPDP